MSFGARYPGFISKSCYYASLLCNKLPGNVVAAILCHMILWVRNPDGAWQDNSLVHMALTGVIWWSSAGN